MGRAAKIAAFFRFLGSSEAIAAREISPLQCWTSSDGFLMGKQPPILCSTQSSKQASASWREPASQSHN